jgi:hypothetical protein
MLFFALNQPRIEKLLAKNAAFRKIGYPLLWHSEFLIP